MLFALFALLLWRVLMAGWRAKDPFGTLFACRPRLDDPVPAGRQRRDGARDHADHRDPVAVRDARWRIAGQHGRRARASCRASTSARRGPPGRRRHRAICPTWWQATRSRGPLTQPRPRSRRRGQSGIGRRPSPAHDQFRGRALDEDREQDDPEGRPLEQRRGSGRRPAATGPAPSRPRRAVPSSS